MYTKNINFFFDCKLLFASTKKLSHPTKNEENVTIANEENAIIANEEEQIPVPETNKKKSISFFFVVFSFLAATLSSAFIFAGTTNYKLDKLAFNINNYNEHYYTEDFKRPFVKIEKNETNVLYDDLFSRFYYSDDSGSVRQYMDNDSRIVINGSASNKVTLFSQSTFAIQNNIAADGGYRVDYGLFHAYFSDNELGGVRSYVGKHFNCDSYIFISDSVADMLLRHYNLPFDDDSKLDSYLKLIQDEKYAVLSLRVDNSTTLKFSINNILYSDKRTAPRCVEFNKYFGLINYMYVSKYFKPCFEIDFKSYSYYITSVLNDSNSLGYTTENSKYDFYTYDYKNNKYLLNQEVTARFKELPADFSFNAFNVLFYCSIWVFGLIYLFLVIKSLNNKSDLLFCIFFEALWLAMYSILGNFFYTCFTFSIVPLMLLIVLLIAKGDLLLGSKRAKQNKESNLDK